MDFNDLLNHEDEQLSEAALIVQQATEGLKQKMITQEQFDELMEDILQIDQMEELANDLERKILFKKAVDIFKMIIKAVPK